MQVINECLKRTSDKNTVHDLLSDALDIAANLQGRDRKLPTSISFQGNLVRLGFEESDSSEVTANRSLCLNFFTFHIKTKNSNREGYVSHEISMRERRMKTSGCV